MLYWRCFGMQKIPALEASVERAVTRYMNSATIELEPRPTRRRVSRRPAAPRGATPSPERDGIVPIVTLVIWSTCLLIGIAGSVFSYVRPLPPAKEPPPLIAQVLNVELMAADTRPAPEPPPQNAMEPPPLVPPTLPAPPPPIAVAAPSPQIAFAVPVKAPARIVPAEEASFRNLQSPIAETVVAPTPVRPLTFGQGEGRQPAPEYPRLALRDGQEGVVTVRLSVGADGRVTTAEAALPSPWPLLNEAAVRVVKTRWRFAPGLVRLYEVAIRFQINK